MKYGCIGEKLSHSYSREIHARLSSETYDLVELSKGELAAFFYARDFLGINVTIPYKEAVIPYLDELDPDAKEIGAVNTIVNRDGRLIGYNTDLYGLSFLLSRMGVDLCGKRVMILGSGGTAKTARVLAERMRAKEVLTVSRTEGKGDFTYRELPQKAKEVEILIQATPVGMYPNDGETPVDLACFEHLEALADAVYHPLCTRLVLEARARGVNAFGGLLMLVAQAAKSGSLFYGCDCGEERIEKIYTDLLREKENLVLVGMPGSGKSSLGRILAKRLGRAFFDLDDEVEKKAGKRIREIFEQEGEASFRTLEKELARELSKQTGLVIATGGGTPLDRENLLFLRQNGVLYALDRPIEELEPSESRPLASNKEALAALYVERKNRYSALCDEQISVRGSLEETANQLETNWRNR